MAERQRWLCPSTHLPVYPSARLPVYPSTRLTFAQLAMLWAPFGTSLRDTLPGSEASTGGVRIGELHLRVWGDFVVYMCVIYMVLRPAFW